MEELGNSNLNAESGDQITVFAKSRRAVKKILSEAWSWLLGKNGIKPYDSVFIAISLVLAFLCGQMLPDSYRLFKSPSLYDTLPDFKGTSFTVPPQYDNQNNGAVFSLDIFVDYACPYSQEFLKYYLKPLLQDQRLRIRIYNFHLEQYATSYSLGRMFDIASQNGQFVNTLDHYLLFGNPDLTLKYLAERLNVEVEQLRSQLTDEAMVQRAKEQNDKIMDETGLGDKMGVPLVVINGEKYLQGYVTPPGLFELLSRP